MKKITGFLIVLAFLAASCENGKKEIPVPDGYKLVWHDEFDYNGLPDAEKWSYDTAGNDYGWGNNELQHYTHERIENVKVDGDYLHIIARKEKMGGRDFTSARLRTKEKGDWLYGKIKVRAKLPEGRGVWPAIWMLPTDWEYGDWPASGEIDIMEHVGYNPDSVFASAHTEAYNHVKGTNKTQGIKVRNIYEEFHTYTLEWEEDEYRVFFDDIHFFTFKNENKTFKEWPFDKRFHILLNVAVGGNWGGKEGVDDSIFPQEMIVDYVRVYKKE
ncbi:MAG: glycoside hydrolase family 16 protein [Bacteroidales bacterium]|nr:glycoside hydrolase family 16 protein [Bacteroidales bacterium]